MIKLLLLFCRQLTGLIPGFLVCLFIYIPLICIPLVSTPLSAQENKIGQMSQNILIVGDSISAGFGLRQNESWPQLLQTRLNNARYSYNVINASLSGDTTGGGRKRIQKSLEQHQPDIVIIELGGNDGLRGFNLTEIRTNLADMIDLCLKYKHKVILVGMQLPPNYGPAYTKQFSSIYQTLATEKNISLVPFLLKGIANDREYFQADQIHPNAKAQIILLDNIWPTLKAMLKK